jgi:mono/diheme cytochrome c family protein
MMDLSGGLIPMQNWYAPSLTSAAEAGVADWDLERIERLLRTGVAPGAAVLGPMAQVVLQSTQYLAPDDLRAMAVFLKSLPQTTDATSPAPAAGHSPAGRGARLYERHCTECHGDQGQGIAGAYPALAGNRAVSLPVTANLVQVVLYGGFPPSTAGNPRPFGMPPFANVLSDADIAAVLTHIRGAWGNRSSAASELTVSRQRGGSTD